MRLFAVPVGMVFLENSFPVSIKFVIAVAGVRILKTIDGM
jgi:hypothetical protein